MARPSLDQSSKFKLLVRRLGIPKPYALGLLETLWRTAWENGEPVVGTAEEVEAAAEWPGEPGLFFKAMSSGRWLDDLGDGRWAIHDFWDHAPDYVRKRRVREMERRAKGAELSAAASGDRSVTGQCADNGDECPVSDEETAPNGRPPAPAPAPAPQKPPSAASQPFPPSQGGTTTASNPPEDPPTYPWSEADEAAFGDPEHPSPLWPAFVAAHLEHAIAPGTSFVAWRTGVEAGGGGESQPSGDEQDPPSGAGDGDGGGEPPPAYPDVCAVCGQRKPLAGGMRCRACRDKGVEVTQERMAAAMRELAARRSAAAEGG
jgi:hypothetical protein